MKKRLLAMLMATAMMTGFMAGCGSSDTSSTTTEAATTTTESTTTTTEATTEVATTESSGPLSIDVILKTTASEYWGYVQAGAVAYGEEHDDVNVDVKGATSEIAYGHL